MERVVVVGAGYAGVHAARALRCRGVDTVVVDPTGEHDLVARLAAVAGGVGSPGDAAVALGDLGLPSIRAEAVAVADDHVALADGRRLPAAAVIVAAGARPSRPAVDGIEHAAPLRTADDARELRERLRSVDEVVIVGGGPTGVQLAGALGATRPGMSIHVVDAVDRLLGDLRADTGANAARILRDRGVELHLGRAVAAIDPAGVELAPTGRGRRRTRLRGLPVWAAGFESRADVFDVPVTPSGRIVVSSELLVDGFDRVFAAGDVAAHLDGEGRELPMSAQIATQAGDAAGANAARLVRGESLRSARLSQRGWVLDLSGGRGLAEFGPVPLAGPFADLVPPVLHDAIDVRHLVEVGGPLAVRHHTGTLLRLGRSALRSPLRWTTLVE